MLMGESWWIHGICDCCPHFANQLHHHVKCCQIAIHWSSLNNQNINDVLFRQNGARLAYVYHHLPLSCSLDASPFYITLLVGQCHVPSSKSTLIWKTYHASRSFAGAVLSPLVSRVFCSFPRVCRVNFHIPNTNIAKKKKKKKLSTGKISREYIPSLLVNFISFSWFIHPNGGAWYFAQSLRALPGGGCCQHQRPQALQLLRPWATAGFVAGRCYNSL